VDGNLAPGEWDAAGRYDFQAARGPLDGGGTVPASFYVMNDATNLYLALRVSVQDIGWSSLDTVFHAPGTGGFGEGSDILRTSATAFEDLHFHPISSFEWTRLPDVADGGTSDGRSATQTHLGYVVYEVVHPLNSPDDRHDFSLTIPKHTSSTPRSGTASTRAQQRLFPGRASPSWSWSPERTSHRRRRSPPGLRTAPRYAMSESSSSPEPTTSRPLTKSASNVRLTARRGAAARVLSAVSSTTAGTRSRSARSTRCSTSTRLRRGAAGGSTRALPPGRR
jgi:hypothetical protein